MSLPVVGGEDGPTSIFLAGNLQVGWLHIFGLIIMVLIMVPNIIYAVKFPGEENKCTNKAMNILEQIGRYGSMLFMVVNVGRAGLGFSTINLFLVYLIGNPVLLLVYWIVWILYFIKRSFGKSMALAILPTAIFLLNALTLTHIPLLITAIIFGVGHIYVTYQNAKQENK